MAEFRRLRTQAERDADGTALRVPAVERDPSLDTHAIYGDDGEIPPAPPRRRWWHRYTRRTV